MASKKDVELSAEEVLRALKEAGEELVLSADLGTHFDLAVAYAEMGLLTEAMRELGVVIQHADGPNLAAAIAMIAKWRLSRCDVEGAIAGFEAALQSTSLSPAAFIELLYDLGRAREAAGDRAGALRVFQQVFRMDKNYRDIAVLVARLQKPLPS